MIYGMLMAMLMATLIALLGSLGYGWHVSGDIEPSGYLGMILPIVIGLMMFAIGVCVGSYKE